MNFYNLLASSLLLILLAIFPCNGAEAAERPYLWEKDALTFAGLRWDVKSGFYSPGKNHWSAQNVWVDENDWLHLRLTHDGNEWQCAEIATGMFGYGLYRFSIAGPMDHMDKNAVLGLFLYPGPQLQYRANAEIDIELSRWGQENAPAGNYTVTPATLNFPLPLPGELSTHQFIWLPDRIEFFSFQGHDELSERTLLEHWVFRGDGNANIPVPPLQLHINYWLFKGKAPVQNTQPEMIIRKFVYLPVPDANFERERLPHQRVFQETE